MVKTILGVLSLLVMSSCSTVVKENTAQPDIMETNKKNLGNLLALYPKPMTVVGAEVEGKVNWLVVGHTGVIDHDRILASMSKSHYTNQGIKQSKRLSVNLVSREMLPKADYVGSDCGHILRCQHEILDVEILFHPLAMYRFGNGDNSVLQVPA